MTVKGSLLLVTAACLLSGGAFAKKADLPAVSHDGLELQPSKLADVVYVRPGADFSGYRRVAILDCPVAFSKDWERDRRNGAERVNQKEMDEIKASLSTEFLKIFTDELQTKGGYTIVAKGAEDVLILRPAIVDLEVSAPDTMAPGRSFTLSDSAGGMTLYLEIFDSVTGQILARAVDRQEDGGMGRIQWQNAVTNKAEADRILRRWASTLRSRLDALQGKSPAN